MTAGPILRRSAPFLLAALSGLAAGLTHPNASFLPLLPVALVPLLFALRGSGPGRAAIAGGVFGTVFWLTTIPWIAFTVERFGEMPRPVALLALFLASVLLALPFAAMGWLVALADPRRPLAVAAAFPAAWVVQEGIRTYFLGGFPWALLSAPLADVPPLSQSAALGGVLLTSGLVALVNASVFLALVSAGRSRAAWLALAAGIPALAFGLGRERLARAERAPGPDLPELRVLLLQPNVAQEVRFDDAARSSIYVDLLARTEAALGSAPADLVVWPESAVPYSWPWARLLRDDVVSLCRRHRTAVLLNTVWSDAPDDDEAPYYNSALLVTPDGAVLPPYHKQRLVPFGEYVPLASVLRRIRPISRAVPGSFSPADRTVVLPLGDWKLGGAVCYEVVYPWIARAEVRAGANLLFTLTNDAWYGRLGARRQHWQAAAFRSVETGRPLVRAAITGLTGVVDAAGRSRTIPMDQPGELRVTLGGRSGLLRPLAPPPAVRLGDAVLWVCVGGVAAGILRRRVSQPRRPAGDPAP